MDITSFLVIKLQQLSKFNDKDKVIAFTITKKEAWVAVHGSRVRN